MFKGVAASPGIVIGKAFVYKNQPVIVYPDFINPDDLKKELKTFENAVAVTKEQLAKIKERTEMELGKDKGAIFEAHLMILEDDVFISDIKSKVSNELISSVAALNEVVDSYVKIFDSMEDDYLKERATDIKDIGDRLSKNIMGIPIYSLGNIIEEVIVIAKDLTPSDTAQMDRNKVLAFATDMGGRTSHTSIMARSLEIPAVVGLTDITSEVKDGDLVIVDGNQGAVLVNPDNDTLKQYQKQKNDYHEYIQELKKLKDEPGETKDGRRRVELSANIGTPRDCKTALANGAEGIGLYRTEFLYMDRNEFPNEEEQFVAYKTVAEAMLPHPVIIRTLDIGGDKKLSYLNMPEEMNPFLGWRAIRLCLDKKEIFKTQLKAILRASSFGRIRIMYPMISGMEEIEKANSVLQEAREELDQAGIPYDRNLEVGIMIEIPSAAVIADLLAGMVDFFSIGTNDLIQYTLAVDRMNEKITHLYDPFHPAILRLIKNVIDSAHKAGRWVGMCGELAGDVVAAPLLLGLGLDEYSMSAASILKVKKAIRSITLNQAEEIAEQALALKGSDEIKMLLESFNADNSGCL